MDKQTLLGKIDKANITADLKAHLIVMVNAASVVDKNLLTALATSIDAEAENLIDQIAGMELQTEVDKYQTEMSSVGDQVNEFQKDLNKKADEVDLAEARTVIQG